jgi:hypothetical protein
MPISTLWPWGQDIAVYAYISHQLPSPSSNSQYVMLTNKGHPACAGLFPTPTQEPHILGA